MDRERSWGSFGAVSLVVLCLFSFAIYSPALRTPFSDDHLSYLAERGRSTSFWEGLRYLDYSLARRYCKGDEGLLRPLVFAWLALLHSLFSYHYVWWNMAHWLLFTAVAWALGMWLREMMPPLLAILMTLIFLSHEIQLFMVSFSHLGGYLIGQFCFLLTGIQVWRATERGGGELRFGPGLLIPAWMACFSYELMVPMIACLWTVFRLRSEEMGKRCSAAQAWLLWSPVLAFALAYLAHGWAAPRLTYVDLNQPFHIFDLPNLLRLPWNMLRTFRDWLSMVTEQFHPLRAGCLILLAVLAVTGQRVRTSWLRKRRIWLGGMAGIIFLYALVLCLGRQDPLYHHFTFFYLAFLLTGGMLVDWHAKSLRNLGGVAAVLICFFGHQIYNQRTHTGAYGEGLEPLDQYLGAVSRWVDQHREEPQFSFALRAPRPDIDTNVEILEGYPDDPRAVFHYRGLTELYFAPYYQKENPKYWLTWKNGALRAEKAKEVA